VHALGRGHQRRVQAGGAGAHHCDVGAKGLGQGPVRYRR
jgi:hypothetical protein